MAKAFSINIFLPEGDPERIRVIERSNWNGQAIDFPRSEWPRIKSDLPFDKPGVYVLYSRDAELEVYVGEADPLRDRITSHYAGRGTSLDWTRCVAFVSQAAHLNKASIRYLEAKLAELGRLARRAKLHNSTKPTPATLSAPMQAEAEGFLDEMLPFFPLLNVDAFELATSGPPAPTAVPRLQLVGPGITAHGREDAKGFLVESGSTARKAEQPSIPTALTSVRAQLVAAGVLAADGADYRLTQNYAFTSPSNAAGVLLGRAANGRTEWKDASGRTLKALQEAIAKI